MSIFTDGNYYAAMNLRTLKDAIHAYASFADSDPYGEIYDKVEAAQNAVQELIDCIESNDRG